jgi:small subunit ribosomal protein S21
MTSVYLRNNESFESLYRRFKRSVEKSGILAELKLKEHFEPPSQKRKRKAAAARKRELKRQEKMANVFKGNKNFKFSKDHTTKIPLPNKNTQNNRNQQQRPRQQATGTQQFQPRYNNNNKPRYNKPYNNNRPQYNKGK